jgi:hypothetical protein
LAVTEEAAAPAAAPVKGVAEERAGPVAVEAREQRAARQVAQARVALQAQERRAARQVAAARAALQARERRAAPEVAEARVARQAQDQAALPVQADPVATLARLGQQVLRAKGALPVDR